MQLSWTLPHLHGKNSTNGLLTVNWSSTEYPNWMFLNLKNAPFSIYNTLTAGKFTEQRNGMCKTVCWFVKVVRIKNMDICPQKSFVSCFGFIFCYCDRLHFVSFSFKTLYQKEFKELIENWKRFSKNVWNHQTFICQLFAKI